MRPMPGFSANLGRLWADLPLPEAVRAAARAGFAAVELHWPYATPPETVRAALAEAGLPVLSLNTPKGEPDTFGTAALPDRAAEARAGVDAALAYAGAIGAGMVHVLAGRGSDEAPTCEGAFRATLSYAAEAARPLGITVLIEALNPRDAPGYHLSTMEHALETIAAVDAPNLRLMFDCYHVQVAQGDVSRRLAAALPVTGHIQIAGAPARTRPDRGELDLAFVLAEAARLGWSRPVGAEYLPGGPTGETLGWLPAFTRLIGPKIRGPDA